MKPKNVIIFVLSFILVSWLFGGMVYAQENQQLPEAPLPTQKLLPTPAEDKVYDPEYKPQDVQAGPAEEGLAVEEAPLPPYLGLVSDAVGVIPLDDVYLVLMERLVPFYSFIAIINFIFGTIILLLVKKKLRLQTVSQGKKRFLYTYIALNCLSLLCSLAGVFGASFFRYSRYSTVQSLIAIVVVFLFFPLGMNILFLIVTGVRRILKRFRKKDQQTAV